MSTSINCRWKSGVFIMTVYIGLFCEIYFRDEYKLLQGCMIKKIQIKKIFFYFYTVMLSDDPMGHTQSTRIYMSLSDSNAKESLEKLQHCLMGVSAWMTGSKLKLNHSKTEFLFIGTKLQREKFLNNFPCLLLGQDTNPSTSAKNIGVLFDSSLNVRKHISQTCRACFYHIRDLRRIRKKIVLRYCQANCSGTRQLDYCNSLFHDMPEKDIARLQRVQNCLSRVVTKAPRFSRSIPILKRLHWLPVASCRIHFKICAITFRTLKVNQPAYLADLLVRPKCSNYLRSTNSNRFVVPRIKTKTGSRAFSISGPALWNTCSNT